MIVRTAINQDLAAVREIGELTWPVTYAFAGKDYVAHGLATWWSDEALAQSLRHTTVLVAEDGGQVVGVGNLDLRGDVPTIWKLYVRPERQGSGVGRALLYELLARAGARPVQLEYIDGNDRAAAFYAKHGFREIRREPGERPGWPGAVWLERAPR